MLLNCFYEEEDSIFDLFLYHNLTSKCVKVRLNAAHYFIVKISGKRKLKQVASKQSSDSDFKDFVKLYKGYLKEPYQYLVNDTTLSSDNPFLFWKNLL